MADRRRFEQPIRDDEGRGPREQSTTVTLERCRDRKSAEVSTRALGGTSTLGVTSALTSGLDESGFAALPSSDFPEAIVDACVGLADGKPAPAALLDGGKLTDEALILYLEGALPPYLMQAVEGGLVSAGDRARLARVEAELAAREAAVVARLTGRRNER